MLSSHHPKTVGERALQPDGARKSPIHALLGEMAYLIFSFPRLTRTQPA